MKILNFGSLNIDHVYKVKSFVTPGETVKSKEYIKKVGGKGLNQSVAMARAGAKVYHAGKVGDDGGFLTDFLEENNVDISLVKKSETATGHAMIQVEESGENCILLFGGANQSITEQEADEVLDNFEEGDYLVIQNETNIVPYVMKKAHDKKMKIVFNPSPITDEMGKYPLSFVDWYILNEVEGEALTGENDIEKIIDALSQKYPSADFVLTLGKDGSVYFGKNGKISVPARSVKAVDTTGAGDTFTGYFISKIVSGESVRNAMECATSAAAKAVTVIGAAESIPYMSDIF